MKRAKVLRISITDRCNLRCVYCMPEQGVPHLPHKELLSYEEIELVARSAINADIRRLRITGGEPLIRKDLVVLIEKLAQLKPQDLALTTNGVLLAKLASQLKKAGLKRVSISLDTLKRERFLKITRRDFFENVLEGIKASKKVGLEPVKINVVVIRGWNDDEICDFVRFASKQKVELRFIELMPTTSLQTSCKEIGRWSDELVVSGAEIKSKIETAFGRLVPISHNEGVAKMFELKDGTRIGLITPISEPFCQGCQRLRLSSDGRLRLCLFDPKGIDLKKLIREKGAGADELREVFIKALKIKEKWKRGAIAEKPSQMFRIGG